MSNYTSYPSVSKLQAFLEDWREKGLIHTATLKDDDGNFDGKYGPVTDAAYREFATGFANFPVTAKFGATDPLGYLQVLGIITLSDKVSILMAQNDYGKAEPSEDEGDGTSMPPQDVYLPPPVEKAGMSTTTWVVLGLVVGTAGLLAWNWYKGQSRSPKLRPARAPAGLSGCGCGK